MYKLRGKQEGIASFLVTFVICIVITLIVVGFGTIARREQRQALDEQLSSQAFYAAESKINQLYAQLTNDPGSFSADGACSSADNITGLPTGVSISCATATTSNTMASYSLAPDQTVTLPVGDSAKTFATISLKWSSSDPAVTTCTNSYSLPNSSAYPNNQLGMIRILLTRLDTGYGRKALAENTLSGLLVPYTKPTVYAAYLANGRYNAAYPNFGAANPAGYDYFQTLGSGISDHGHGLFNQGKGVGYTSDEYNRFQKQVNAGKTINDFPGGTYPNYGPTSPSGDAARVSWLPFWNWLADYRTKFGASAVPAAYTQTTDWTKPPYPKITTTGNYIVATGDTTTSDDNPQYFQNWASAILNANPVGNVATYPDNDPATKYYYEPIGEVVPFPQTVVTDNVSKPVFFGYCRIESGKPVAYANINLTTPANGAQYQLTFHNMYKLSDLTVTAYEQGKTTPTSPFAQPASGGSASTGQATFDVTAKAQDVVRRIKVHISYGSGSGPINLPMQAIRSGTSICKVLDVTPTNTTEGSCP